MVSQGHVRLAASLLELLKLGRLSRVIGTPRYGIDEIFREDEGNPLSVDSKLLLVMPQKVTKVNVEDLSIFVDHDIVRVPVSNPQDKSCNAIAKRRSVQFSDSTVPFSRASC